MDNRGTPRGTHRAELRLQIQLFCRCFPTFDLLVPALPPPFPSTHRFGGFETPGIGWWVGYRGEEKGKWAQWATAELGGTPRNHGQWEDRPNGPPRTLAAPHGTWRAPRHTKWTVLTPQIDHFSRFSISPLSAPLPQYPKYRRFRNAMYGLDDGILERWGMPVGTLGDFGTPRNLAEPHGN